MVPMALSRRVAALGLAVDLLFPRERAREVRMWGRCGSGDRSGEGLR